ncbi:MAG: tail fiber domain-containing protein [Flavobacterium sp.]
MPIRVYYEVLNQKGTPALYSDNFASRPAAGYVGRIFNSPDTGQIFYDTGTTWTLLADAGVGSGSLASVCANGNTTATGIQITAGGLSTNSLTSTNLTAGSMPFIGTGGLFSQDNANFFWDNTNKRLGIRTNTPSVELDLHSTANVQIHLNNTTTADSKIAFLNASVGKWRIGNLYSGGANLFHIYNNTGATLAMQIDSTNAALFYGNLSSNGFLAAANGVTLTNGGTTTTAGATNIGGLTAGLSIALASGFNQTLTFPTGVGYTYTFPSATGTLALTSNLGGTTGYLPKYASGTSLGQSLFYDNGTAGYIGATTGGNGLFNTIASTGFALDAAGYVVFRGDLGVGTPRQLQILCSGANEVYFNTSGYGGSRSTLMVFQTTNGASVNTNQLVLDQNGYVNIGSTAIGTNKLQVYSNGTASAPIKIQNSAVDGYSAIELFNSSGSQTGAVGYANASASVTPSNVYMYSTSNITFLAGGTTERMRITSAGSVGIGTTTPSERLDVVGGALAAGNGTIRTGITYSSLGLIGTFTNHALGFITNGVENMRIRVDGAIFFNSFVYNNTVTGGTRTLYIDNSYALGGISSIRNSKKNINNVTNIDWLYQLNPVTFNYRKKDNEGNYLEEYYNELNYGLIAEDTQNVADFLCNYDDNKLKGIEYSRLITPLLVSAISHEERIKALEQKLN